MQITKKERVCNNTPSKGGCSRLLFLFAILFLSLSFLSIQAEAQQLQRPDEPPPGTVASDEDAELRRKKPFDEFKVKPVVEIEREEKGPSALPMDTETKFFIKEIKVLGNTKIPTTRIKKVVSDYENREISLAELMELADKITAIYASKGYVTSQAYLPPQQIENQTVTIQIIEGEYGKFLIEGGRFTRSSIVKRRLKKHPGQIFNYNDLRKDLLYLNINPDRIVKATMLRGEEPKTTDFKVVIKDGPPLHFGYDISNTGSKFTGNWLHTYKATNTGFLMYDDTLSVRLIRSENGRMFGGILGYVLPVNEHGTTMSISFSHFETWSMHGLKEFDIKSWSDTYSGTFSQPIFDIGFLSGTADVAMDIKNSLTEMVAMPYSRVRLRILKTGITLEESDKWGRTVVRNQLDFCDNTWLGSGVLYFQNPERPKPDANFIKYSFRASRLNILPLSATLLLSAEGQISNNALYSSEQHRIGGAYSVRGYTEAKALGDNGINITSEIRFPLYFIPEKAYICNLSPRQMIQGVAFLDGGAVQLHDPFTDVKKIQRLMGAGFGFRISIMNAISARLDVAWGIGSNNTMGRDALIHLYASYEDPTLQDRENLLRTILYNKVQSKMNAVGSKPPSLEMVKTYEDALKLEKEGKYDEARELYEKIILKKNEVLIEAKAQIDEAIKREGEAKVFFDAAERLFAEGDYIAARDLYEKVLATHGEGKG